MKMEGRRAGGLSRWKVCVCVCVCVQGEADVDEGLWGLLPCAEKLDWAALEKGRLGSLGTEYVLGYIQVTMLTVPPFYQSSLLLGTTVVRRYRSSLFRIRVSYRRIPT